jgi:hypothetical protein
MNRDTHNDFIARGACPGRLPMPYARGEASARASGLEETP